MQTYKFIPCLFFFSSFCSRIGASQEYGNLTAYELLEKYSFPKGILPEGVQSYSLQADGSFKVFSPKECEFKVQNKYWLKYDKVVSGRMAPGALRELEGVNVKVLFVWLGITDVVVDGSDLKFFVGLLSAGFPTTNFDECPQCRCGFNCAHVFVSDL